MLRRLLGCRRGAVSLMVTAIAIPMIGLAGLGAEAGSWYLIRRHAQNAADSAALAGAYALAANKGTTIATQEGQGFASKNGFSNGATLTTGATQTVTIAYSGGNTIVTATVQQFQPPLLARIVGLTSNVQIRAVAVAQIQHPDKVCALGLNSGNQGGLVIGGSQTFRGGNCALATNTTVKFNGPPTFNGTGWAVDGSTGCNGPNCTLLPGGVSSDYHKPVTKPPTALVNLEGTAFPAEPSSKIKLTCSTLTCADINPAPPACIGSACWQGDLLVKNGGIQNLACPAGSTQCTFYFDSINVQNGALLSSCTTRPTAVAVMDCNGSFNPGVNIIVGAGGININGNVALQANPTNSTNADLDGVLFYDPQPCSPSSANCGSTGNLAFNGNPNSVYGGAMFFPNADVTWIGNGVASNKCTMIIGNSLTFTGNNDINLDWRGCNANDIPQTQTILLIS